MYILMKWWDVNVYKYVGGEDYAGRLWGGGWGLCFEDREDYW